MKKVNAFQAFFVMIPKIARADPLLFHVRNLAFIAQGVTYGIIAPLTQNLFDAAVDFADGKTELAVIITGLFILALAHVFKQAINGIANFISYIYWGKIEGVLSLELHRKMNKISPDCFEDTRILDEMNKAVQGKDEAAWYAGTILFMLCTSTYYLVMAVYLIQIKPILVVSLALVFIPTSEWMLKAKSNDVAPFGRDLISPFGVKI